MMRLFNVQVGQGEAGQKSQAKSISDRHCQQVGKFCHLGRFIETRNEKQYLKSAKIMI